MALEECECVGVCVCATKKWLLVCASLCRLSTGELSR